MTRMTTTRGTDRARLGGILGGMRGYADPVLLIILWVVIASAGAWGYVETKRSKATEENSAPQSRSNDSDDLRLADYDGSGEPLEVSESTLKQPQRVEARHEEP